MAETSQDTIFALSSGMPPAAIAIVRLSGPRAPGALESLAGSLPEPRAATLARLRHRGETLDEAIVLRFPSPASVTGEDVVELHLHGGRAVVAAVRRALLELGLREAEPGEFTRRAFANGRIDLSEAEGLADLLAAETESQRRAALAMAGGALSRKVEQWRVRLLECAAAVEAELDHGDEEDVAPFDPAPIVALREEMEEYLRRPSAERLRDGVRVVIAGPPNAGKSTLFNRLVGREAAITAATPGTTRDLIEAPVALEGVPLLFVDTAGLRETEEAVEAIGVDRAAQAAAVADIILWLGEEPTGADDAIWVSNKVDLDPNRLRTGLPVSAKTGSGLEALRAEIISRARSLLPAEGELALSHRQRDAIGAVAGLLDVHSPDPLIIAEHLRQALVRLDRITGRAGVEDMLDALFARFCIGK